LKFAFDVAGSALHAVFIHVEFSIKRESVGSDQGFQQESGTPPRTG
jgi:hypothetical protein